MWGLLREASDELAKNWLAFLRCFWLTSLLWTAAIAISVFDLTLLPILAIAFAILVFLGLAPGAVAWHRYVIAGEPVSWMPRKPDFLSFMYGLKLVVVFVVSVALNKFIESIVMDLLLPIIGLFSSGAELPHWLPIKGFSVAASTVVFVLILAPWMLRLPEGSLDPGLRGARKTWPPHGKRHYLSALATVYLLHLLLDFGASHFVDAFPASVAVMGLLAGVVYLGLSLSLLTVVYRRNMDLTAKPAR